MKVNVLVRSEIELNPGDVCQTYRRDGSKDRIVVVERITQNSYGVKVVFVDGTWRPLRTYGRTWKK